MFGRARQIDERRHALALRPLRQREDGLCAHLIVVRLVGVRIADAQVLGDGAREPLERRLVHVA
jgi:hypothetical protein